MVVATLLRIGLLLSVAVTGLLFVLVWRKRHQPGASAYAVMLLCILGWEGFYGLTLGVSSLELNRVLFGLTFFAQLSVSVLWLVFALQYTGRNDLVTGRTVGALLVVPVLTPALALTNDAHGLLWSNYHVETAAGLAAPVFTDGPLFVAAVTYAFALVGIGLAMLLEFTVGDDIYEQQTLALMFGAGLPSLTSLKFIFGLGPLPAVDLTPLAFTVTAPVVGYALLHHDLFALAPATRRVGQQAAIDDFGDGVLIVDTDGRVVDANTRIETLLSQADAQVLDVPVEALLDVETFDPATPPETVRLETNEGQREYDLTISEITDGSDAPLGYTVVLHDVTDEKQRRQRLEVLNRVLRHNLRNKMTAVMGYAEHVGDHTDEEGEWMIDRIAERSDDLVALSEKARQMNRVTDPSRSHSTFEIGDIFETVQRRLDEDDDEVTTTVTVPGTLTMTSDKVIVEEVVGYAAETLLEYNTSEEPRLVFTATPTDTPRPWIDIIVTDNGSGVPEEEQAVIKRGSETPLEHSHDIDLWLVNWGVETLGGELSFLGEDNDRPGMVLSLPDFDRDDDGIETEDGPSTGSVGGLSATTLASVRDKL